MGDDASPGGAGRTASPDLGEQPMGAQALSVVVELVERKHEQMVWLGVMDLPQPKKDSEVTLEFARKRGVQQLLQPLPCPVKTTS